MKTSIYKELLSHVIETIEDMDLQDFEELHFHAFNKDYYIDYHSDAKDWINKHELDAFDVIQDVIEYEQDNFGEVNTEINPSSVVNMYIYILGDELLQDFDLEQSQEDLLEQLKAQLD
jgi:hypothetical protein